MTEQIEPTAPDDEPVSKRTRRSGVVASVGDPTLKDRTKVAPLFLTKKEKQDKLYKKEQDKLAQSTKTRLNDWKSVIGVEKDASKVCPVFQRASIASSSATAAGESRSLVRLSIPETPLVAPMHFGGITPDPFANSFDGNGDSISLEPRKREIPRYEESFVFKSLHNSV